MLLPGRFFSSGISNLPNAHVAEFLTEEDYTQIPHVMQWRITD
jgi:hypothetical protein